MIIDSAETYRKTIEFDKKEFRRISRLPFKKGFLELCEIARQVRVIQKYDHNHEISQGPYFAIESYGLRTEFEEDIRFAIRVMLMALLLADLHYAVPQKFVAKLHTGKVLKRCLLEHETHVEAYGAPINSHMTVCDGCQLAAEICSCFSDGENTI